MDTSVFMRYYNSVPLQVHSCYSMLLQTSPCLHTLFDVYKMYITEQNNSIRLLGDVLIPWWYSWCKHCCYGLFWIVETLKQYLKGVEKQQPGSPLKASLLSPAAPLRKHSIPWNLKARSVKCSQPNSSWTPKQLKSSGLIAMERSQRVLTNPDRL